MKNTPHSVGVVIIGRNEGDRLVKCIDSVNCIGVPVVYVDSQSTDESIHEAEKRRVKTIVLDSKKRLSAARARNEGFDKLVEFYPDIEFVHFIDGDCELNKGWLVKALDVFKDNVEVAVTCGQLREKFRNRNVYMRLCDMDWDRSPGVVDSCGGIATFRREIFEHVAGFDASLIAGEEAEVCSRIRKMNFKILCLNDEMGTHDSAMMKFSQWWMRCVKVGFGNINVIEWSGKSKRYKSALFWGGGIPFLILSSLYYSNGWSASFFILYPVQVYRIYNTSSHENLSKKDRLLYSFFCILSKFPEVQGVGEYFLSKLYDKEKLMQYK